MAKNSRSKGNLVADDSANAVVTELKSMQTADWDAFAPRPIEMLWVLTMLSCGLIPEIKNEEFADSKESEAPYWSRLRHLRGRILDCAHHDSKDIPKGYLRNYRLARQRVAVESVDNEFVSLSKFVEAAKHYGWNVPEQLLAFASGKRRGVVAGAISAEAKRGPNVKWNDVHQKVLYGVIRLGASNPELRHLGEFVGEFAKSKLSLGAISRRRIVNDPRLRQLSVSVSEQVQFLLSTDAPDDRAVENHFADLATYLRDQYRPLPPASDSVS